jgi:hypothetical protein
VKSPKVLGLDVNDCELIEKESLPMSIFNSTAKWPGNGEGLSKRG